MVGETIQQRAGGPFRAEHAGPFVEEQVRSGGRPGHVAQFVDDQQAEAGQIPLQVEQRYLIPGFQRSALHRFHRRDASARFPSPIPQPRRLPWAYCADMTTWSVSGGTSPRASLSM